MPRSLSPREREALEVLLSGDFPGVDVLRDQACAVRAEREGLIIDLVVAADAPRAEVVDRVPVQAVVDGDGYDGGLLLYVDDGRLSALEYWWVTEDPPDTFPPQSAIGRPLANGVAADLAAIAADVERQLPEIKAGSLCVYGDIFGGRVDNIHAVVGARVDEHEGCLVVEFSGGESLSVWDPGAVTISERVFRIGRASRVRWEWYYYGRPRLPENRYYIEHVRTDDGVRAQTNVSWAPHRFAPSPRQPAVELLGY